MTQRANFSIIWIMTGSGFIFLAIWLQVHGHVSSGVLDLWSKAILQLEGPTSYKASDSLFPPLPLMLTIMLQHVLGFTGIPVPFALSAVLAGLLAALWYSILISEAGYRWQQSLFLTGLLITNPVFVLAVAEGPELILLCIGAWIFSRNLIILRLEGGTPEMVKVATGLMIAGLSSPYGLLIAFASLPFMAIAARPEMLAKAPIGYLLVMSFPVICSVGSLLFISHIFNTPLITHSSSLSQQPEVVTILVILYALGLPIWCVAVLIRSHAQYFVPLLCGAFTFGGTIALNLEYQILPGALVPTVPLVPLAAVALQFWPRMPGRYIWALTMIVLSWIMSAQMVIDSKDAAPKMLVSALAGRTLAQTHAAYRVVAYLKGRNDILIDAERNPELVVLMQNVDGLVLAGSTEYELTLLGSKPVHDYIVTRQTDGFTPTSDRVTRRFPETRNRLLFGYTEVLEDGDWIIWKRVKL